jgi:hypothetical protein
MSLAPLFLGSSLLFCWPLKKGDHALLMGNDGDKFPTVTSPEGECSVKHGFANLKVPPVKTIA